MTCQTCQSTYGNSGGHCAACHQSFTSQTSFDAHRTGPYSDRRCIDVTNAEGWRIGRGNWWTNAAEADRWDA